MKAIFKKNNNGVTFVENIDFEIDGGNSIEYATPSLKAVKARYNGEVIVGSCYPEPVFNEKYKDSAHGIITEAMERIAYHCGLQ